MNPLAISTEPLGCLTPGPELLKQLMLQPLGSTPLRVRSGGSSSRCASNDCWTLDLGRLRDIQYHENSKEVEFGTGLTMAELLQALRTFGRSVPIGLSGLTGSGFVLTGGMGPLSRSQGLALDSITGIEGIWGSGEPFTFSAEQKDRDARRWRGLMGASPFLAVVTRLRLRTQPIQPLRVRHGLILPSQLQELLLIAEHWPESCSLQWSWGERLEIYAVDCSCTDTRSKTLEDLDPFLGTDAPAGIRHCGDQLEQPTFGSLASEVTSPLALHSEVTGRLGPALEPLAGPFVELLRSRMQERPHRGCRISAQQLGGATTRIDREITSFRSRKAVT